ncbi:MAG: metallophosphoesterase [Magnetococcales bacterium]|nr:metallophosphoesterase [Magnetococcales bacterium]
MPFMKLRPDAFYTALAETPAGVVRCRHSWRLERERRERVMRSFVDQSGLDRSWIGAGMRRIRAIVQDTAFYRRGIRNALAIRHVVETLTFPNLPAAFDGYELLQVSDPHFGVLPELDAAILQALAGQRCDLCVLTGDFRARFFDAHAHALTNMRQLIQGISARDGFIAILGNHDTAAMVSPLEESGYRVLINEHLTLPRQDAAIRILGLDDPHFFPSEMALSALAMPREEEFGIVLVHTPELVAEAARHGFDLYLCGHTHGGQICWPTGRPIITGMRQGSARHGQGLWRHGNMTGRTSNGLGSSAIPARYFNRPETVRIILRRGA